MSQKISLALFALLLVGGCQSRTVDEPTPPSLDGEEQVLGCEDDSECPERAICRGGVCEEVGAGCASKSECSPTEVCVDGACVPPTGTCASSDECPGVTMCDGFSRTCFDPNATGCQSDGDCALEPGCDEGCVCGVGGACVPVGEDPGTDPGTDPGDGEDPTDPLPPGGTIDLGGFVLENREDEPAVQLGVLPEGLTLAPGQRLVIGRDASQSAFESFWGVSFDDDVVYLNAETGSSGVPIINGGERWALVSPLGTVVDGTTIAGSKNESYRRLSSGAPGNPSSWHVGDALDAAPGDSALPATGVGLVVSQWSDAKGSGAFVYEFVELYYAP